MFFKEMLIYCIIVIVTIWKSSARDLPSHFPRCHIDDPKLNECLLNATRTLKPQIIKGIQEIKLPPFNPLNISEITVSQDNGKINYTVTFGNVTIHGFDSFEFDEIKYDPKTLVLNERVRFKDILYQTDYISRSWLIYFPVIGEGACDMEFKKVNGTFEIKGKLTKWKDIEHYSPTSTKVRMKVDGFSIFFKNDIYEDNPELSLITSELFNLNGQEIVDAVTPALEVMAEKFLLRFMTTLTRIIPYNKLFPHS